MPFITQHQHMVLDKVVGHIYKCKVKVYYGYPIHGQCRPPRCIDLLWWLSAPWVLSRAGLTFTGPAKRGIPCQHHVLRSNNPYANLRLIVNAMNKLNVLTAISVFSIIFRLVCSCERHHRDQKLCHLGIKDELVMFVYSDPRQRALRQ